MFDMAEEAVKGIALLSAIHCFSTNLSAMIVIFEMLKEKNCIAFYKIDTLGIYCTYDTLDWLYSQFVNICLPHIVGCAP